MKRVVCVLVAVMGLVAASIAEAGESTRVKATSAQTKAPKGRVSAAARTPDGRQASKLKLPQLNQSKRGSKIARTKAGPVRRPSRNKARRSTARAPSHGEATRVRVTSPNAMTRLEAQALIDAYRQMGTRPNAAQQKDQTTEGNAFTRWVRKKALDLRYFWNGGTYHSSGFSFWNW